MASSASKDPVCGMTVSAETKHRHVQDGVEYLFGGARCGDRSAKNPSSFLRPHTPPSKAPVRPDATYPCPMHPEAREPRWGSCQKCGMALEPMAPKPIAAAE